MSVLHDTEILARGSSLIHPFDPKCVQPASYDLTLHGSVLIPMGPSVSIDLRKHSPRDYMLEREIGQYFELKAGSCILGSTIETIHCPIDCVARVEGKSSIGRLFLAVHVTAGFVDPNFSGQITLEIVNHGPWDVVLWTGMRIAQINFAQMLGFPSRPYGSLGLGSHYQNQSGPTAASGKRDNGKEQDEVQTSNK